MIKNLGKLLRGIFTRLSILKNLESWVPQNSAAELPTLYIIGAPRSGTTLLYQVLIHTLKAAYVSNIASVFPYCPGFVSHLALKFKKPYRATELSSNYGNIAGLMAPSEAARVMDLWFDRPSSPEALRSSKALKTVFKAPLVIKNVWNIDRLSAISNVPGRKVFLIIHRDIFSNAKSIVKAEEKGIHILSRGGNQKGGDPRSLKEAVQFIVDYNAKAEVLSDASDQTIIRLSYEQFCKDPFAAFEKIVEALGVELPDPLDGEGVLGSIKASVIKESERERMKQQISSELCKKAEKYESTH